MLPSLPWVACSTGSRAKKPRNGKLLDLCLPMLPSTLEVEVQMVMYTWVWYGGDVE